MLLIIIRFVSVMGICVWYFFFGGLFIARVSYLFVSFLDFLVVLMLFFILVRVFRSLLVFRVVRV